MLGLDSGDSSSSSGSLPRERQICELVVKLQLRLEIALDTLIECQRKQAALLRLERMDIRADLNTSQNIPMSKTKLRLQGKIRQKTQEQFRSEDASFLLQDFHIETEKAILETQALSLRREIDLLKSKADLWRKELNI